MTQEKPLDDEQFTEVIELCKTICWHAADPVAPLIPDKSVLPVQEKLREIGEKLSASEKKVMIEAATQINSEFHYPLYFAWDDSLKLKVRSLFQ